MQNIIGYNFFNKSFLRTYFKNIFKLQIQLFYSEILKGKYIFFKFVRGVGDSIEVRAWTQSCA